GVLDHRYDQPPVERDRDADVDVALVHDRILLHGGVHHRELAQHAHHGGAEEGHEGEPLAGLGLEARLVAFTDFGDGGGVHGEDAVDVGRGALAHHHVLGDDLAHLAHGLDGHRPGRIVHRRRSRSGRGRGGKRGGGDGGSGGGRTGRRGAGLDVVHQVALGDAAAVAGGGHRRQIHFVLVRQAAHQRGGTNLTGSSRGRGRGGGGRRGRGRGRHRDRRGSGGGGAGLGRRRRRGRRGGSGSGGAGGGAFLQNGHHR